MNAIIPSLALLLFVYLIASQTICKALLLRGYSYNDARDLEALALFIFGCGSLILSGCLTGG